MKGKIEFIEGDLKNVLEQTFLKYLLDPENEIFYIEKLSIDTMKEISENNKENEFIVECFNNAVSIALTKRNKV